MYSHLKERASRCLTERVYQDALQARPGFRLAPGPRWFVIINPLFMAETLLIAGAFNGEGHG